MLFRLYEEGEKEKQHIRGPLSGEYLEVLKVSFPSFKGKTFF